MTFHYVWLIWASTFLVPWLALYLLHRPLRSAIWKASIVTASFGLTEPIFVPRYWNPPSLFELAQRTGFDLESLIFTFAIGGIATVLYTVLRRTRFVIIPVQRRIEPLHRFHAVGLCVVVTFVPLLFLPWNVIYAAIVALVLGSAASVVCRPQLARAAVTGGALFFGLYAMFMFGLSWFVPGYIAQVWNLSALSGILIAGIPVEEFFFGAAFGLYWSSVYEHLTWTESV